MRFVRAFRRWVYDHRANLSYVGVVVVATALVALLAFVVAANRDRARQGQEAHLALCVLKHDLEGRAAQSRKFLKHPPATILGIPVNAAVIASVKSDLASREATIRSLMVLDCSDVPPELLGPAPGPLGGSKSPQAN